MPCPAGGEESPKRPVFSFGAPAAPASGAPAGRETPKLKAAPVFNSFSAPAAAPALTLPNGGGMFKLGTPVPAAAEPAPGQEAPLAFSFGGPRFSAVDREVAEVVKAVSPQALQAHNGAAAPRFTFGKGQPAAKAAGEAATPAPVGCVRLDLLEGEGRGWVMATAFVLCAPCLGCSFSYVAGFMWFRLSLLCPASPFLCAQAKAAPEPASLAEANRLAAEAARSPLPPTFSDDESPGAPAAAKPGEQLERGPGGPCVSCVWPGFVKARCGSGVACLAGGISLMTERVLLLAPGAAEPEPAAAAPAPAAGGWDLSFLQKNTAQAQQAAEAAKKEADGASAKPAEGALRYAETVTICDCKCQIASDRQWLMHQHYSCGS